MIKYLNVTSPLDIGGKKMKMYRFQVRNIGMDLLSPTVEAFEEFYERSFVNMFIKEELKEMIKKDLQLLIDTKTYEVIEDGE